jgi:acetyltransferase-like isoleucine patch superfamily enzyme
MPGILKYLPRRIRIHWISSFLKRNGVTCNVPPFIEGYLPEIDNSGKIILGSHCHFSSFRLRQYIKVWRNGVLDIGCNSFINDGVNLCASQFVKIGHSAKIGDMVYIYDTDFHEIRPDSPVKQRPVSIGNNVWICAHSMVLAGSSIGDHSVVAAGSIVTGEIPAKSLAAGSPARVIKRLDVPDNWIRA